MVLANQIIISKTSAQTHGSDVVLSKTLLSNKDVYRPNSAVSNVNKTLHQTASPENDVVLDNTTTPANEGVSATTVSAVNEDVFDSTATPANEGVSTKTVAAVNEIVFDSTTTPGNEEFSTKTVSAVNEVVFDSTPTPGNESVSAKTADAVNEVVFDSTTTPGNEGVSAKKAAAVDEVVFDSTTTPVNEGVLTKTVSAVNEVVFDSPTTPGNERVSAKTVSAVNEVVFDSTTTPANEVVSSKAIMHTNNLVSDRPVNNDSSVAAGNIVVLDKLETPANGAALHLNVAVGTNALSGVIDTPGNVDTLNTTIAHSNDEALLGAMNPGKSCNIVCNSAFITSNAVALDCSVTPSNDELLDKSALVGDGTILSSSNTTLDSELSLRQPVSSVGTSELDNDVARNNNVVLNRNATSGDDTILHTTAPSVYANVMGETATSNNDQRVGKRALYDKLAEINRDDDIPLDGAVTTDKPPLDGTVDDVNEAVSDSIVSPRTDVLLDLSITAGNDILLNRNVSSSHGKTSKSGHLTLSEQPHTDGASSVSKKQYVEEPVAVSVQSDTGRLVSGSKLFIEAEQSVTSVIPNKWASECALTIPSPRFSDPSVNPRSSVADISYQLPRQLNQHHRSNAPRYPCSDGTPGTTKSPRIKDPYGLDKHDRMFDRSYLPRQPPLDGSSNVQPPLWGSHGVTRQPTIKNQPGMQIQPGMTIQYDTAGGCHSWGMSGFPNYPGVESACGVTGQDATEGSSSMPKKPPRKTKSRTPKQVHKEDPAAGQVYPMDASQSPRYPSKQGAFGVSTPANSRSPSEIPRKRRKGQLSPGLPQQPFTEGQSEPTGQSVLNLSEPPYMDGQFGALRQSQLEMLSRVPRQPHTEYPAQLKPKNMHGFSLPPHMEGFNLLPRHNPLWNPSMVPQQFPMKGAPGLSIPHQIEGKPTLPGFQYTESSSAMARTFKGSPAVHKQPHMEGPPCVSKQSSIEIRPGAPRQPPMEGPLGQKHAIGSYAVPQEHHHTSLTDEPPGIPRPPFVAAPSGVPKGGYLEGPLDVSRQRPMAYTPGLTRQSQFQDPYGAGVARQPRFGGPVAVSKQTNIVDSPGFPRQPNIVDLSGVPRHPHITGPHDVPRQLHMAGPPDVPRQLHMAGPSDVPRQLHRAGPSDVPRQLHMAGPPGVPRHPHITGPPDVPRQLHIAGPPGVSKQSNMRCSPIIPRQVAYGMSRQMSSLEGPGCALGEASPDAMYRQSGKHTTKSSPLSEKQNQSFKWMANADSVGNQKPEELPMALPSKGLYPGYSAGMTGRNNVKDGIMRSQGIASSYPMSRPQCSSHPPYGTSAGDSTSNSERIIPDIRTPIGQMPSARGGSNVFDTKNQLPNAVETALPRDKHDTADINQEWGADYTYPDLRLLKNEPANPPAVAKARKPSRKKQKVQANLPIVFAKAANPEPYNVEEESLPIKRQFRVIVPPMPLVSSQPETDASPSISLPLLPPADSSTNNKVAASARPKASSQTTTGVRIEDQRERLQLLKEQASKVGVELLKDVQYKRALILNNWNVAEALNAAIVMNEKKKKDLVVDELMGDYPMYSRPYLIQLLNDYEQDVEAVKQSIDEYEEENQCDSSEEEKPFNKRLTRKTSKDMDYSSSDDSVPDTKHARPVSDKIKKKRSGLYRSLILDSDDDDSGSEDRKDSGLADASCFKGSDESGNDDFFRPPVRRATHRHTKKISTYLVDSEEEEADQEESEDDYLPDVLDMDKEDIVRERPRRRARIISEGSSDEVRRKKKRPIMSEADTEDSLSDPENIRVPKPKRRHPSSDDDYRAPRRSDPGGDKTCSASPRKTPKAKLARQCNSDDDWVPVKSNKRASRKKSDKQSRKRTRYRTRAATVRDTSSTEENDVASSSSSSSSEDEKVKSDNQLLVEFFNDASIQELMLVERMSKKKAEFLTSIRPFSGIRNISEKISLHKRHLDSNLIQNGRDVIFRRRRVRQMMEQCESLSDKLQHLVSRIGQQDMNESQDPDLTVINQPALVSDNPDLLLKPYQIVGLNWLALMHREKVNCILADEMGLGKTIQTIAFLAYLHQQGERGPHLIVVPSSTLVNWINEIRIWCPSFTVVQYYGSMDERRQLRQTLCTGDAPNVVLTTYNIAISQSEDRWLFVKKMLFYYVIFDEGHMLKNMSSNRYKQLIRIRAKRRLLLTGTPLQNSLLELLSLLFFIMPSLFSEERLDILDAFNSISKNNIEAGYGDFEKQRTEQAKRIMTPFVLRRLKKDVIRQLPEKHDSVEMIPLLGRQAQLYKDLKKELSKCIQEQDGSSLAGAMMQLRKAANHPLLHRSLYTGKKLEVIAKQLVKEPNVKEKVVKHWIEDMEAMSDFNIHRLCCKYKALKRHRLKDDQIFSSGKVQYLDKKLSELEKGKDRVLLFSQFTMVLDILEEFLDLRNIEYRRLDGSTPVHDRQTLIDEFNNNNDIYVFLLSTRAGGLGINLTAANTVIIHDLDFNPYNDKQAEDRCHRVGQTRAVHVIRLVGESTIEEGILKIATAKRRLEKDMDLQDRDDALLQRDLSNMVRVALGGRPTTSTKQIKNILIDRIKDENMLDSDSIKSEDVESGKSSEVDENNEEISETDVVKGSNEHLLTADASHCDRNGSPDAGSPDLANDKTVESLAGRKKKCVDDDVKNEDTLRKVPVQETKE